MNPKKIDFLSKFLCVVNRKICYILSIIVIVPLIDISTTLKSNQASVIYTLTMILYIVIMYTYYRISLKYKKDIEFKKIKTFEKIKFIIMMFIILSISICIISIAIVMINIKDLSKLGGSM